MESFGIASVATITAICYLIGMAAKLVPRVDDRIIPIVCGFCGGGLGLAALYLGNLPDFPAEDPLTALAVGIVSGLAATGINQAAKQMSK